jgi:hypothetical protein
VAIVVGVGIGSRITNKKTPPKGGVAIVVEDGCCVVGVGGLITNKKTPPKGGVPLS